MFAKRLLHKAVQHHYNVRKIMSFFLGFFPIFLFFNFDFQILILFHFQHKFQQQGSLQSTELDPRIVIHYGIPSSSSVLAFDPIQRLLAIGTLSVLHSLSPLILLLLMIFVY